MATKTLYKIQIGAYKYKENAEKIAAVVRIQKFPAVVIQINGLWKVQSGAFSIKANAEKRLKDIHEAGLHLKDPYKDFKDTFRKAIMVTVPGYEDKKDEITAFAKVMDILLRIMDSKNPHQEVINLCKKHGHTLKSDSAWCTETIVCAFLEAGYGYLIGEWAADAPSLKAHGKKLGIWHDGSSGVKAGDIVLYGSDKPNHTEIAIDGSNNISGNYQGTVKKRKRSGRKIHGYLRPKYPVIRDDKEADSTKPAHPWVRVWFIKFWESDPEKYGDATAFIQYAADNKTIDHVVLVDTGMNNTDTIKKLKAAGVTKIDAIIISHDHSDHYGYLESCLKSFKVGHVYFPDQTGVKKYQPEYASRITKQAAKCTANGVGYSYVKVGDSFEIGAVKCKAIFQADASKLTEKENHHFINNLSLIYHIIVDDLWIFDFGGDAQAEAQRQMLEAFKDRLEELKCDGMKIRWHGDRDGIIRDYAKAVQCLTAVSNYHGSASAGGRKSTYKVFEDFGAMVLENWKHGEVYQDVKDRTMEVSCSKTGHICTFFK